MSLHEIHSYNDADALAVAAAKRFVDTAKRAVARSGRFIVVLSGGSTPRGLYGLLTTDAFRGQIDWPKAVFLFSDERCVPPDHERSNYRMARETLFDPLEIAPHQVVRMKGEQAPAEAASRYAVRINDVFLGREERQFDLVLLGVGADGHTASLFPGTPALEETERWVVAHEVPQVGEWRLTLTYPALCSTRRVLFLALGEKKAEIVASAFGGVPHEPPYPCERVVPHSGPRRILLDRAAASKLPQPEPEPSSPS